MDTKSRDKLLSVDIEVQLDSGFRRHERAVIQLHNRRGFTLIGRETQPLGDTPDAAIP